MPGDEVLRQVHRDAELEAVRALDGEALDLHLGEIGRHVLVLRQLRRACRSATRNCCGTSVGLSRVTMNRAGVRIEDRRDALEDVGVVALVDARLLAGLDRDLVDERLRADLVRRLRVGRALVEDVLRSRPTASPDRRRHRHRHRGHRRRHRVRRRHRRRAGRRSIRGWRRCHRRGSAPACTSLPCRSGRRPCRRCSDRRAR